VEDANKKLAPHFLAVLNTEVDEEGQKIIRKGNARELRARFKDAQFFWDFDQKTPLAERVESLKNVTFQKELGSYHWKTEQNEVVARRLFDLYSKASPNPTENTQIFNALQTAVRFAKTDLTTELVKEFTELQGIVGGLYARAQGFDERVARAIYDQYTPASIEDPIPLTIEGQLLGLADRVQSVTAMFSIGLIPSGSKDPYALRRSANSIVKILAETNLPLKLSELVHIAPNPAAEVGIENTPSGLRQHEGRVLELLRERLHFYLKDVRGFAYDVVNAVLAASANDVRDAIARAEALTAVRGSEDFAAVSAAFKRIKNILKQAEEKNISIGPANADKFAPEARQLSDAAAFLAPRVAKLRQEHAYEAALSEIATLRPTVDLFFDKVMVLDPDESVRGANLAMIDEVLRNFSGIAEFSEIVTS
jgi:glycyl-tRNA synthetase beta chain